jgi:hypothetical protein
MDQAAGGRGMVAATRSDTGGDVIDLRLTLALEPGIIIKGAVEALQTARGRDVVVQIARATAAKSPAASRW